MLARYPSEVPARQKLIACSGYVDAADSPPPLALDFEIFRGGLAFIRDLLVLDDLTLIQAGEAGLLDGRDVNENVPPAAALRLNEPVSLLTVEPLHRAACHRKSPNVREACIAHDSQEIHE
jgi:hypothetical protein